MIDYTNRATDSAFRAIIVIWVTSVAFGLTLTGLIIWAVVHFIHKFW